MAHSVVTEMTKRLMADALKKKMAQKSLNKITVKEIVEECGLNRQTFYYHFQDIYDLVEWMFEQEAINVLEKGVTFHSWQDACLRLLHYVEANRAVCLCALNSMGHSHLEGFFYKNMKSMIRRLVDEAAEGLTVPERCREFLSHYYATSFAGILISWLRNDLPDAPEDLIDMLSITVSDNIRLATERFAARAGQLGSGSNCPTL